MIKVLINKKEAEIEENLKVCDLLNKLKSPKSAVWINGKQLLKSEYDSEIITSGDDIKILRVIAGG